jgi:predicted ester cyclase
MKKSGAALLVALSMLSSAAATADDVAENTRVIRRLYDELFSKWNLAVIDEIIGPEFLGHGMPPGIPRGPEGVRQFYAGIRAGLPDFRITVQDLFGAGDRVVVRWHATATHTGTFRGMPPTGAPVTLDGIAIYRLQNGKAVERWVQVNMLGLVEQIRAAAAAATARP